MKAEQKCLWSVMCSLQAPFRVPESGQNPLIPAMLNLRKPEALRPSLTNEAPRHSPRIRSIRTVPPLVEALKFFLSAL
jgi:hypothetical protein